MVTKPLKKGDLANTSPSVTSPRFTSPEVTFTTVFVALYSPKNALIAIIAFMS